MKHKRGDIVLVDLEPVMGSEQGKIRPCIIVQNDIANKFSPVTNIIPVTDAKNVRKWYPCLVNLEKRESGLEKDSVAQCNQIRTIDAERRIIKQIGNISGQRMKEIDQALKIQLALE
ncbi:MAG: type II toxin-antitoxin system PemK/MazF family toxin [Candidatus Aminicenantes bacterium]|nr:type II toxin-antitoxin system PemK/MazF family toxin [Candidatus Aminicenantes bacterium]